MLDPISQMHYDAIKHRAIGAIIGLVILAAAVAWWFHSGDLP